MAAVPEVTLTVTLQDFTGDDVSNGALIITLCGFGQTLPRIEGTSMIARPGPLTFKLAAGTSEGISLWGNDQITPLAFDGSPLTYYSIALVDNKNNIVQSGIYQFIGEQTIDLSDAPQLFSQPSYPFFVDDARPSGVIDGINSVFELPSSPLPPASLELYKNGDLMNRGSDYTLMEWFITYSGIAIPEPGDTHIAFYRSKATSFVAPVPVNFADDVGVTGVINGVNRVFTLPSVPNPASSLKFFYNGQLFNQGTDYILTGNQVNYLNFAPQPGDTHEAFYRD